MRRLRRNGEGELRRGDAAVMPEVIVKLLATLAILCGLLPLGTEAATAAAGTGEDPHQSPAATASPRGSRDAAAGERKHTGEAETDTERLACAIYNEAGGDMCSDECRVNVGDVILNRRDDPRFPDTIEGVLTAPGQYGRFSRTGIVWPERAQKPEEAAAVERAWRIAEALLAGEHGEMYGAGYVWQAEFEQGSDGFWLDGLFFGR